MDVLKAIIGTFVAFILLISFSMPVYYTWETLGTSANDMSPSVGENYSGYRTSYHTVYNIVFAIIMIGGGIAVFLGIAVKRRRIDEYERYGGDYEY